MQLLQELMAGKWPGNVRELMSFVERAVISSTKHALKLTEPHNPFSEKEAENLGEKIAGMDSNLISAEEKIMTRNKDKKMMMPVPEDLFLIIQLCFPIQPHFT